MDSPREVAIERSGDQIVSVAIILNPLMSGPQTAVSGGSLVAAVPDAYEVRWIDLDGTLRRIVRYDMEPIPASPASVDAMLADSDLDAEQRRAVRDNLPAEKIPDYLPTVSAVMTDRLGNAWVQQFRPYFASGPSMWTVIAADGVWLGTVELPDRFVPLEIGEDFVLGAWEDELDVEYVLLYDLIKPR